MIKTPFEAVAKAEDLGDLLDHIAWREVILPELIKARDNYTKMLVSSTLGLPVMVGAAVITREQLAGRIDGINFITGLMEDILKRGYRAAEELRANGLSLAHGYDNGSSDSHSVSST